MPSIFGIFAILAPALGFYAFSLIQWGVPLFLLGLAPPVLTLIVLIPVIYLSLTGLVSVFLNPNLPRKNEHIPDYWDSHISPWRRFAESALLTLTCLVIPVFPILPLLAGIHCFLAFIIRGPSQVWSDVKDSYTAIKNGIRPFFLGPRIHDRFFEKFFKDEAVEIEKSNFDYLVSLDEKKSKEVAVFINSNWMMDVENKKILEKLAKKEGAFQIFFNGHPVNRWKEEVENLKFQQKAFEKLQNIYFKFGGPIREFSNLNTGVFIENIMDFFDFFEKKEDDEIARIFSEGMKIFSSYLKEQKLGEHVYVNFLFKFIYLSQIDPSGYFVRFHDFYSMYSPWLQEIWNGIEKRERNKKIYQIFFQFVLDEIKKNKKPIIQQLIEFIEKNELEPRSMICFFDAILSCEKNNLFLEDDWFEEKNEPDEKIESVSILDKLVDDLKEPEKFFRNIIYIEEWIEARLSTHWPEEIHRLPSDVVDKLNKVCSNFTDDDFLRDFKKEIIQKILLEGIPLVENPFDFFKKIEQEIQEKFKSARIHFPGKVLELQSYRLGTVKVLTRKKSAEERRKKDALELFERYLNNPDAMPDEENIQKLSLAERLQVRDVFCFLDEKFNLENQKILIMRDYHEKIQEVHGQSVDLVQPTQNILQFLKNNAEDKAEDENENCFLSERRLPAWNEKKKILKEKRIQWWGQLIERQPQIVEFKGNFLEKLNKTTLEESKLGSDQEEKSDTMPQNILIHYHELNPDQKQNLNEFNEQLALTMAIFKRAKTLYFGCIQHAACCKEIESLLEALKTQVKGSKQDWSSEQKQYVLLCCNWVVASLKNSDQKTDTMVVGKNEWRVNEKTVEEFQEAIQAASVVSESLQVPMYRRVSANLLVPNPVSTEQSRENQDQLLAP